METEGTDSPGGLAPPQPKLTATPSPQPPKFLRAGCPSCRPTNMTGVVPKESVWINVGSILTTCCPSHHTVKGVKHNTTSL